MNSRGQLNCELYKTAVTSFNAIKLVELYNTVVTSFNAIKLENWVKINLADELVWLVIVYTVQYTLLNCTVYTIECNVQNTLVGLCVELNNTVDSLQCIM